MEISEAKQIVDTYRAAGKAREETVAIISTLPINGESSEVFEYCDIVYKTAPAKIETHHFTDSENGEYFTVMYSEKLRYDHRRGRWLEWREHYWRTDDDGQITRLMLRAMRDRYRNTVDIEDNETRIKAAKKAISSEQRARLDAALALSKDFKPLADAGDKWDKNNWLMAVANGVIDLRTCELRPGKQDDAITMTSPVSYAPEAGAPRWLQFLDEVFEGNKELISWLQKYFGYTLTGTTKEQIIPIGYGRGANGKTVLLTVTRYIMGDYAYDAPFSTFELFNRSAIPNDLAALDGKRFVTSSETTEGSRFNEARIKALTGCDTITARFLHAEFFTFQPVAKFFLAVNSRPRVNDDSYGFWRRVRLIPFTRQFMNKDDDKDLTAKLIAESSGILGWMLEGCRRWQVEGMEPTPECITIATREYESESDPLSEFIFDECAMTPQAYVQSSRLYKHYKDWAHEQGMADKEILTLNAFGRRMGQKFEKSHKEGGAHYVGLALRADGFLTDFEATSFSNELNPTITRACGKIIENTGSFRHSDRNEDLPPYPVKPCPKCGSEWMLSPNGDQYICEKGHRQKV